MLQTFCFQNFWGSICQSNIVEAKTWHWLTLVYVATLTLKFDFGRIFDIRNVHWTEFEVYSLWYIELKTFHLVIFWDLSSGWSKVLLLKGQIDMPLFNGSQYRWMSLGHRESRFGFSLDDTDIEIWVAIKSTSLHFSQICHSAVKFSQRNGIFCTLRSFLSWFHTQWVDESPPEFGRWEAGSLEQMFWKRKEAALQRAPQTTSCLASWFHWVLLLFLLMLLLLQSCLSPIVGTGAAAAAAIAVAAGVLEAQFHTPDHGDELLLLLLLLFLWQTFLFQITGTGLLLLLVLAVTDDRNIAPPKGIVPLIVGFIVTSIGFSFGYNHGYAINPARDLGPRIFTAMAGWGIETFTSVKSAWGKSDIEDYRSVKRQSDTDIADVSSPHGKERGSLHEMESGGDEQSHVGQKRGEEK